MTYQCRHLATKETYEKRIGLWEGGNNHTMSNTLSIN